jgi:hypothetical protein
LAARSPEWLSKDGRHWLSPLTEQADVEVGRVPAFGGSEPGFLVFRERQAVAAVRLTLCTDSLLFKVTLYPFRELKSAVTAPTAVCLCAQGRSERIC